ncbi:HEPN domain-containing protein [Desulfobacterota bacterium AH_259_B03_O07]|nr:HEPN domain-containing protein [Desulfobacterota bacterium AH_259_B03_O07]
MISHKSFLEVAEKLLENGTSDDSAFLRSSISRAYYFAFHHVREKLKNNSRIGSTYEKTDNVEHHRINVESLYKLNHSDIADRLGNLRRMRNNADYELDRDLNRSTAERLLKHAKWISAKVDRRI